MLVIGFKKSNIFIFPIKMAEKYAKFNRLESFDADFNKVHLFKLSEMFTTMLWKIDNLKLVKKSNIFFNKKSFKNIVYYIFCIGQTRF